MQYALAEAKKAFEEDEVPVGAVITDKSGEIIGTGRNSREGHLKIEGHAEINAINEAAAGLGTLKLEGCELYVTLEPCAMCTQAIIDSGIKTVFYGADSPGFGACGGLINLAYPRLEAFGGFLAEESEGLLGEFFEKKRKKNEKNEYAGDFFRDKRM